MDKNQLPMTTQEEENNKIDKDFKDFESPFSRDKLNKMTKNNIININIKNERKMDKDIEYLEYLKTFDNFLVNLKYYESDLKKCMTLFDECKKQHSETHIIDAIKLNKNAEAYFVHLTKMFLYFVVGLIRKNDPSLQPDLNYYVKKSEKFCRLSTEYNDKHFSILAIILRVLDKENPKRNMKKPSNA